jgi:hypothetical protein
MPILPNHPLSLTNRSRGGDNGPMSVGVLQMILRESSAVDVVLTDSRQTDFEVVVTVERLFTTPTEPNGSPWRTRCVGISFSSRSEVGSWAGSELRPTWVKAQLPRFIEQAREAARELEADAAQGSFPRLPAGSPRRANRLDWYAALLRFVDFHLDQEMARMDIYRLIAKRKGVKVNNVKQWVFQARRLKED